MIRYSRKLARRAFTLVELIIVLIIVATLAGLIVPNVSMIGRSADMAATASSQRELCNNIGMYFVLQKRFPIGMDSLLVGDGTAAPTAVYGPSSDNSATGTATTDKNLQVAGLPVSGAGGANVASDIVVTDLSTVTNGSRSLTRAGFEYVYDHDYTVTNSNESTSNSAQRSLSTFPTVATVNPASTLFARLLPNGLPPRGTVVVALGFGGRNDAIGKTVNTAPIYPGNDGLYYGRYIAYFVLYDNGERCTLVGMSDAYGRTQDYANQQFTESLPNGSRQG